MANLVEHPDDKFSHVKAQISLFMRKSVFGVVQPSKTQTSLLNYRDYLESGNFGYSKYRYYTN